MWEVETEGRMMKIRPASSSLIHSDNGWLLIERHNAIGLAQVINEARKQDDLDQLDSMGEGEDG